MLNWRPILYQHNIHVLHDRFEKRRGNARTMDLELHHIPHHVMRLKSDEWRDRRVFDVRGTDVYAILLKMRSNPISFQRLRDKGRTGQDLLQQVQTEIVLLHYVKDSNFGGRIIRDRRGQ